MFIFHSSEEEEKGFKNEKTLEAKKKLKKKILCYYRRLPNPLCTNVRYNA